MSFCTTSTSLPPELTFLNINGYCEAEYAPQRFNRRGEQL